MPIQGIQFQLLISCKHIITWAQDHVDRKLTEATFITAERPTLKTENGNSYHPSTLVQICETPSAYVFLYLSICVLLVTRYFYLILVIYVHLSIWVSIQLSSHQSLPEEAQRVKHCKVFKIWEIRAARSRVFTWNETLNHEAITWIGGERGAKLRCVEIPCKVKKWNSKGLEQAHSLLFT